MGYCISGLRFFIVDFLSSYPNSIGKMPPHVLKFNWWNTEESNPLLRGWKPKFLVQSVISVSS